MESTQTLSDASDTIKPSLTEAMFLRSLGLQVWSSNIGDETYVGDVRPFAEDEPTDQQTVISVYVRAMPAQAFRFEILRRSEHFDGMEKLSVRTGSGSLETFWEMALAVAGNMLAITAAQRV